MHLVYTTKAIDNFGLKYIIFTSSGSPLLLELVKRISKYTFRREIHLNGPVSSAFDRQFKTEIKTMLWCFVCAYVCKKKICTYIHILFVLQGGLSCTVGGFLSYQNFVVLFYVFSLDGSIHLSKCLVAKIYIINLRLILSPFDQILDETVWYSIQKYFKFCSGKVIADSNTNYLKLEQLSVPKLLQSVNISYRVYAKTIW